MATFQDDFLRKAASAARAAGHPFPEYAACEAALESAWGQSGLATRANNLFGQKQSRPPLDGTGTLSLPTREFLGGVWVTVNANWVLFTDWSTCFNARMRLLQGASRKYPHYAAALAATTGEEFVREVSQTWSTDPARANKVLSIYCRPSRLLCLSPVRSGTTSKYADSSSEFRFAGGCTWYVTRPWVNSRARVPASCDVPPSQRWCESASPATAVPSLESKDWRGTSSEPRCREVDSGSIKATSLDGEPSTHGPSTGFTSEAE